MNTGDFVNIEFVGKVKDTGEVFDVTSEEVAKKEKIFDPRTKYGAITVVVDAGLVLKGLDEALKEMKIGEKKTVEISPDKAFGERKAELIKVIPMHNFKEQNVDPTPGSYVTINNLSGRVISIDGGRVRVDFNHPLAGKKLEYDVEVKGEVKDAADMVKGLTTYYTGIGLDKLAVTAEGKNVDVKLGMANVPPQVKKTIADAALKWIKDIDKIKFVDEFAR
ncbi:peptidylprolyl isomerase [archaeon]|nr:MAG: peptidylprolyl isomerase [archaeon]